MTTYMIGVKGYEKLAEVVPEPHRTRLLLLIALKKLLADARLRERTKASVYKHERTRNRATGEIRHVIHLRDCPLRVATRPGLPVVARARLERLDAVFLCGRCKPELAAILTEHAGVRPGDAG